MKNLIALKEYAKTVKQKLEKFSSVQTMAFSCRLQGNKKEWKEKLSFQLETLVCLSKSKIEKYEIELKEEPIPHGVIALQFKNGAIARLAYTVTPLEEDYDCRIYTEKEEFVGTPLKNKLKYIRAGMLNRFQYCKMNGVTLTENSSFEKDCVTDTVVLEILEKI